MLKRGGGEGLREWKFETIPPSFAYIRPETQGKKRQREERSIQKFNLHLFNENWKKKIELLDECFFENIYCMLKEKKIKEMKISKTFPFIRLN